MTYRSQIHIHSALASTSEAGKQRLFTPTSPVARLREALESLRVPFNNLRRGTKYQTNVSPPVLEKIATPRYHLHVTPSNTLTLQTSSSFTVLSGRKLKNNYGAKAIQVARIPTNSSAASTYLTTTSGACGHSKNWEDEWDDDLAVLNRIQSAFIEHEDEIYIHENSVHATHSVSNSSTTHKSDDVIRPTLEGAFAHDDEDGHSTTTATYSFTTTEKSKPEFTASHTTRDVFKALNAKLDALSALLPPDAVSSNDQSFSFPESRSFHARGIAPTF